MNHEANVKLKDPCLQSTAELKHAINTPLTNQAKIRYPDVKAFACGNDSPKLPILHSIPKPSFKCIYTRTNIKS